VERLFEDPAATERRCAGARVAGRAIRSSEGAVGTQNPPAGKSRAKLRPLLGAGALFVGADYPGNARSCLLSRWTIGRGSRRFVVPGPGGGMMIDIFSVFTPEGIAMIQQSYFSVMIEVGGG